VVENYREIIANEINSSSVNVATRKEFAEGSKTLLDRAEGNNFVGTLKIMSNAAKNFDVVATDLSVRHNYFDSSIKLFCAPILILIIFLFCLCYF